MILSNGLNSPQLGKYRLCIVQLAVFTCPQLQVRHNYFVNRFHDKKLWNSPIGCL